MEYQLPNLCRLKHIFLMPFVSKNIVHGYSITGTYPCKHKIVYLTITFKQSHFTSSRNSPSPPMYIGGIYHNSHPCPKHSEIFMDKYTYPIQVKKRSPKKTIEK